MSRSECFLTKIVCQIIQVLGEIHGSQVEKAPERGLLHRWFGKDPNAPCSEFTGVHTLVHDRARVR